MSEGLLAEVQEAADRWLANDYKGLDGAMADLCAALAHASNANLEIEEAARALCDAVDAYFDPENQYTESRLRAVLRSKKALRDALSLMSIGSASSSPRT